jgi:TonB family protein
MSFVRVTAVAAAFTVHIGAIAGFITFAPGNEALESGSGQDKLSVIASVTIEPDDGEGLDSLNQEQRTAPAGHPAPASSKQPAKRADTSGIGQQVREDSVVGPSPGETGTSRESPTIPSLATAPEEERHAASRRLEARRNELFSLYNAAIYKAIAMHAIRPEAIKNGQVGVELTLSPAGKLLKRRVVKSSGVPVLDDTAIASLSRVPFPAAPEGLLNRPYTVALSFDYAPE